MIIAIDGSAASGKGTLAKGLTPNILTMIIWTQNALSRR